MSDPAGFGLAPQQKFQNYKFQIAEQEENSESSERRPSTAFKAFSNVFKDEHSQQDSDTRPIQNGFGMQFEGSIKNGSIKNDNLDLDAIVRAARTAHSGSLQIGPTRNFMAFEEVKEENITKVNLNLGAQTPAKAEPEAGSPQDRLGKHRPVQDAIKEEDEGQETGANALTQKDYLQLQIEALWAQYDTDGLGHLDNIEAANFVSQILKSHGHDAPSFEQLNKCFQEFQDDGNIAKKSMAGLIMKFVK